MSGQADERLERSGFALLKGENLEVYVKKYLIELGRRSKNSKLDVVLGAQESYKHMLSGCWCPAIVSSEAKVGLVQVTT